MERIFLLREKSQGRIWQKSLESLGFQTVLYPLLKIIPKKTSIKNPLEKSGSVIFTSANAVRFFLRLLKKEGIKRSYLVKKNIITVGKETGRTLKKGGIFSFSIAPLASQEGILALLPSNLEGQSFLFPASSLANPKLANELKKRGANVIELAVYDTVPEAHFPSSTLNEKDAVFFTSSSTVRHFFSCPLGNTRAFIPCCFSENIAGLFAAYRPGLAPIVAKEPTLAAMIASIPSLYAKVLFPLQELPGSRFQQL